MTDPTRITDPRRLKAVHASGMFESAPEPEFDRLARLAAQLLHAPAAFITVLNDEQQYLKSAIEHGERHTQAGTSMDLDRSFGQHAIAADAPFIVEDAREHELVKNNKSVQDGVIAYAGIPLHTYDGQAIGALCVIDSRPRKWSDEDIANLHALARGAMQLIDEKVPRAAANREEFNPHTVSLVECVAHHFRAAKAYDQLVSASGPLDLQAEATAREQLLSSMADLRQSYDHHSREAGQSQPALVAKVERYLAADEAREEAARDFGQGSGDLASLEGAIQKHMDAADTLRITAIDHGADI